MITLKEHLNNSPKQIRYKGMLITNVDPSKGQHVRSLSYVEWYSNCSQYYANYWEIQRFISTVRLFAIRASISISYLNVYMITQGKQHTVYVTCTYKVSDIEHPFCIMLDGAIDKTGDVILDLDAVYFLEASNNMFNEVDRLVIESPGTLPNGTPYVKKYDLSLFSIGMYINGKLHNPNGPAKVRTDYISLQVDYEWFWKGEYLGATVAEIEPPKYTQHKKADEVSHRIQRGEKPSFDEIVDAL